MAAGDIVQSCPHPQCGWQRRGFIGKTCSGCGRPLMAQVHRSSSVYTPRSIVLVNAPDTQQLERVEGAGGSARALDWVVRGMRSRALDVGVKTAAALRASLASTGLSRELIEEMVTRARERGEIEDSNALDVPAVLRIEAEKEARNIAIAFLQRRNTVQDLQERGPVGLRAVYQNDYPRWLGRAGLAHVDHTASPF
jgi:GNAT superfamily N-acetyltransferase